MAEFDLSSLPDLVLVDLFKMLPVFDRGHLASCNRRLARLMNTSDLWREVNLDLTTDLVHCESKGGNVFVDRIHDCDWVMLKRYSQHFWRVKVSMRSGIVGNQTLAFLTKLCERNVIKSVSLRLDRLLSTVMNWHAENPSLPTSVMWPIFFNYNIFSSFEPEPGMMHSPASHLTDNLSPDAEFTIALPPQSHHIKDFFEQGFYFSLDIYHFAALSYCFNMSKESCSLLKKLILSPHPVPEEAKARNLREDTLLSRFSNLQELHVNIISLSDQLLLELCGAPGRRTPLCRLVIRHIVCDCEVEGMSHTQMQLPFSPWNQGTFPQLSSAAWHRLAQSSPSLSVECSVVSDKLPQLLDVIKPETPLVRLEVLCRTTRGDDQSVPVLQELRESHSRLTIVGVRFRACKCTNADA